MTPIKYRNKQDETYLKTTSCRAKPFVWFVEGLVEVDGAWVDGQIQYENHYPDHDLLISEGFYKEVDSPLLPTQKHGGWVYEGKECALEILDKTSEEIDDDATVKFQLDMAALDTQFTPQMMDDLWRVASGQISHANLTDEYRTAIDDPTSKLPIDVLVQKKIDRRKIG